MKSMMIKIKFYLTLTIIVTLLAIVGVQTFRLWLGGVESSPIQSMYRRKPPAATVKPLDPPKGGEPGVREVRGYTPPPSPKDPSPSFTIGRWELENIPCNRDATFAVTVDEGGNPVGTMDIQNDGFAELGYMRELSLYYTRTIALSNQINWGQEVGIEYNHDLFRIGPAWVSGRLSAGWEQVNLPAGERVQGAKVLASVKVGVRF